MGPSGEKNHFTVLEATAGLCSHPPAHLTSAWTGQRERWASSSLIERRSRLFSHKSLLEQGMREKITALLLGDLAPPAPLSVYFHLTPSSLPTVFHDVTASSLTFTRAFIPTR